MESLKRKLAALVLGAQHILYSAQDCVLAWIVWVLLRRDLQNSRMRSLECHHRGSNPVRELNKENKRVNDRKPVSNHTPLKNLSNLQNARRSSTRKEKIETACRKVERQPHQRMVGARTLTYWFIRMMAISSRVVNDVKIFSISESDVVSANHSM
jgi:hypothetical protein